MKVKKIGHCCFVVEPKEGIRIMTDPGVFSTMQNEEKNISAILITHEHPDHLHIESLQKVLANNKDALVITNTAVGKLLDEVDIKYTKVEESQSHDLDGVNIKGFGNLHAEIYKDYGRVQNTGYMINTLCYPGDALENPNTEVDILALPITGPWMDTKDAVNYAKTIKPRIAFPVHDAHIHDWASFLWRVPGNLLEEENISFKKLELGKEEDL